MTRRALTKEEEEQIPVYLNSPYIEDDLCYAWWEDQLVWSDLEGALWYYDENNEEISDQDFEKRFQDINTSQVSKLIKKPSPRSIKEHTFAGHSSANSGDIGITN